ncbi:MAG TPA: DUF4037 domain-containing protein [Pilimelia sp.]|nr:DUF4037 domain-containing protein [Pilimelia sp.]
MTFVPGLELSRRFHADVVGPLLARSFPGLPYAAGRLDSGSELLGYDTPRSTDHDWGLRLQVFLHPADAPRAADLLAAVDAGLPATFLGRPTRFTGTPTTGLGVAAHDGDRHGVDVTTAAEFWAGRLGFDPRAGVRPLDWLATPTQRLAEVTGGAVYHDGLGGALTTARAALAWYPDDVWRYVLAAQWARVGQEEHLAGRAAEVGDGTGSAVLAARLVRDLMRLCLLLGRRYPPYGKWLGTAFAGLPGIADVAAAVAAALSAPDWPAREEALCRAYELVAGRTNAVGLAPPVDPGVRGFHDRPFRVLDAGRLARALRSAIADPWLRALPQVGAVDQWADSTDALVAPPAALRAACVALLGVPNDR